MTIKLSNSATNTLKECGKYYEYHYIDRIRPITTGSALVFGIAMDNALNDLLMAKLKTDYKILDYKDSFLKSLSTVTINDQSFNAKDCEFIQYSKSDIDLSLLEQTDINDIDKYDAILSFQTIPEFIEWYQDRKPNDVGSIKTYNYIAWHCLYRRGLMLIDAYIADIYNKIEYVESIQEKVSLPNPEGDEIVGVIDAIIKFKDDDKIYICDNKTSSLPYKDTDLTYSKQLATYAEYKANFNVAYLVVEKKIRKTEPRTRTQILKGTLTDNHISKTFQDYQHSLEVIKSGQFDKNESKCYNWYGRPCVYLQYCKYNKSAGLVKLEKKNE